MLEKAYNDDVDLSKVNVSFKNNMDIEKACEENEWRTHTICVVCS